MIDVIEAAFASRLTDVTGGGLSLDPDSQALEAQRWPLRARGVAVRRTLAATAAAGITDLSEAGLHAYGSVLADRVIADALAGQGAPVVTAVEYWTSLPRDERDHLMAHALWSSRDRRRAVSRRLLEASPAIEAVRSLLVASFEAVLAGVDRRSTAGAALSGVTERLRGFAEALTAFELAARGLTDTDGDARERFVAELDSSSASVLTALEQAGRPLAYADLDTELQKLLDSVAHGLPVLRIRVQVVTEAVRSLRAASSDAATLNRTHIGTQQAGSRRQGVNAWFEFHGLDPRVVARTRADVDVTVDAATVRWVQRFDELSQGFATVDELAEAGLEYERTAARLGPPAAATARNAVRALLEARVRTSLYWPELRAGARHRGLRSWATAYSRSGGPARLIAELRRRNPAGLPSPRSPLRQFRVSLTAQAGAVDAALSFATRVGRPAPRALFYTESGRINIERYTGPAFSRVELDEQDGQLVAIHHRTPVRLDPTDVAEIYAAVEAAAEAFVVEVERRLGLTTLRLPPARLERGGAGVLRTAVSDL